MKILILEDEIYLAQKLSSRLFEEGHACEHFTSFGEVDKQKHYDTVLLSMNLHTTNCDDVIKHYKDSIVILFVTYISDATVGSPIKLGAKDYVQKPFMMDELIRKIHHYQVFNKMQKEICLYQKYFDTVFDGIECELDDHKLPVLVETNDQKYSDKLFFEIAKKSNLPIKIIPLSKVNIVQEIKELNKDTLYYMIDFHSLKKSLKDMLQKSLEGLSVVISSLDNEPDFMYDKIELKNSNQIIANDNIMTINEYVRLVVNTFQDKYPDTELSKKLGISRKSLWEKRKKLGVEKKK